MATADQQAPSQARPRRISRRLEWALIVLIILIAAWLRMANPGLTEFKADEARLLSLALDMAEGQFALRGISSSVGFPNFPASVWLYSLPLIFWPHPYAATIFTGLLNTLAVGGTYWLVRRYWGMTAALPAALMLAVSPWAVIFSRKIWAQNLLPLFVLGWAVGAVLALVEQRPKFIWLHLVCLALAVQIHLAAAALVPATALILIVFWRRIHWPSLFIGLLLAGLTIGPFAIYFSQTGDPFSLNVGQSGSALPGLSADPLLFTIMISLGTNIHSLAGPQVFSQYLSMLPPMAPAYWLWALLILGGITWLAWRVGKAWDQKASQVGLIILIWLLSPLLFFLPQFFPSYLHYFIDSFPAQYIAAGVAFAALIQQTNQSLAGKKWGLWLRASAWAILLASAVLQIWAITTLFNFVASNNTPGGHGTPLALKMETAQTAKSMLALNNAHEIIIAGAGESVNRDAFPAVWDVLLRDTPHRFADINQSALFPAHPAIVLLDGRQPGPTWTGDLYQQTATSSEVIKLRPAEGNYTVLTIPGNAKPAPQNPADPPHLLANWVTLLGYDLLGSPDQDSVIWQIHWQTADNPDPQDYHFFNHLMDQNSQRIAQADAAAFSPQQWDSGDTLISRFLLPWPDADGQPAAMRVGMYRYPSLDNVPLLDVAGNPYVDAATFFLDNNVTLREEN